MNTDFFFNLHDSAEARALFRQQEPTVLYFNCIHKPLADASSLTCTEYCITKLETQNVRYRCC